MMKKGFFLLTFLIVQFYLSQTDDSDTIQLSEVRVSALAPVTKSQISKKDISNNNLAQDLPYLLTKTPSTVVTSDAGNGVGYTGIRIRGVDPSRILVTIDGVPINDSESQSVFWVDLPDVASSAGQITVQRGVGSSSNGTSNFGGSIGIKSSGFSNDALLSIQSAGGSFGTYKNSLVAESGDWAKDKLNLRFRISQIHSDGYVDRATSNLLAYQLEGKYQFNESNSLKINYLSGKEKTYQAWYGVDKFTLENDRRFNYAGAIYNDDYSEILGFYPNQIDDYKQDHFFLKFDHQFNEKSWLNTTGYFTYGRGFYEELAQFQNPEEYKINDDEITDLVRRKWLKNYLYGINSVFNYKASKFKLEANLALSQYQGNHFGQVINSSFFPVPETVEYYRNQSIKNDFSSYAKIIYGLGKFKPYIDLQVRNVDYQAETPQSGIALNDDNPNFHKKYWFFNPKIGFTYKHNLNTWYGLWAVSNREPTRSDLLENSEIKPEKLNDFELGYQRKFNKLQLSTNLYYMLYDNQLVLSGRLDDVGNPIRENSGKSYRFGWETELEYQISNNFLISGNVSWSQNRNRNYLYEIDGIVENLGDTSLSYSPDLIANLDFQWRFKGFEFHWVNKYIDRQYLDNTSNKELALDSYFYSNFSIIKSLNINGVKNFAIIGQFNNIFNELYESNGYVYAGSPYYYPQAGFNFMLGVNMGF